jgi:hypothetical protein
LYVVTQLQNDQSIAWDKFWNPKIVIDNAVGDPKEVTSTSVVYDTTKNWEAFVIERRRVKGTFMETLELFQFPFDSQVLSHR